MAVFVLDIWLSLRLSFPKKAFACDINTFIYIALPAHKFIIAPGSHHFTLPAPVPPPYSPSVPAPRQLTVERQLHKSVLLGWTPTDSGAGEVVESYHVFVDGLLRCTVSAGEQCRALLENVDLTRVRGDWGARGNGVTRVTGNGVSRVREGIAVRGGMGGAVEK